MALTVSPASLLLLVGISGCVACSRPGDSPVDDSGVGDSRADDTDDSDTDSDSDSDTDTAPAPTDADGDGQTADEGDCDDGDATIYRGAADVQDDAIDTNCDGIDSERFVLAEAVASARLVGDLGEGGYGNTAGYSVVYSADATGDGRADVYASAPVEYFDESLPSPNPTVWLIAGSTVGDEPLVGAASTRWDPGDSAHIGFGERIDNAGDIDGDGLGDVAIGVSGHYFEGNWGFAGIYLGGSAGAQTMDDYYFAVDGGDSATWLGAVVTGDVDTDGDGLLDLAVYYDSTTLIFHSPERGLVTVDDADVVVDAVLYPLPGRDHDVNGDGHEDFMLYNTSDTTRVSVVAGPLPWDTEPTPLFEIGVPEGGNYNFSLGDVNGDAQPDLAFGVASYDSAGTNSGRVGFFLGPLAGERDFSEADAFLDAEHSQVGLSRGMSIAGDLNGDGDDEIVVGAPGVYAYQTGAVVIFADLWAGVTTTASADIVLDGAELGGGFGWSLATDGDLDGDGLDDLVTGAPWDQAMTGSVWLIPAAGLAGWWR